MLTKGREETDVNSLAQILYAAAVEVEQRGVCRKPKFNHEVCAVTAILDAPQANPKLKRSAIYFVARYVGSATEYAAFLDYWNDSQSSRAVVAAEMRAAAQLADLMGDKL